MSQENVERIRSAFAGTTAGDFSYLPGLIDDSCEFLLPPNFPGTQATRGPRGFLSVVQEFEETRYEPREFLDQGTVCLSLSAPLDGPSTRALPST